MVRVVKSEWHQVEKRYGYDFDEGILSEIYPDMDEADIQALLEGIISGETDVDQIIQDSYDNNVDIDWEWLDEDDWWTDRKGGYQITYEVSENQSVNEKPTVAWPFAGSLQSEDDTEELTEEELDSKLNELKSALEAIELPDEPIINDTASEFDREITIQIRGRGTDRGLQEITQAQYEYWLDNEDDLSDALNSDYDYEENQTPESARLPYEYYNEYTDSGFFTGPDSENVYLSIEDDEGNTLFGGDIEDFATAAHGEEYYEAMEEEAEMYFNSNCLKPGYYIHWSQGGKGTYFSGTITIPAGELFDGKLLKFYTTDFQGNGMITRITYKDEIVYDEDSSWSGQWSEYQVFAVEE
jgi:hypothetical protein